MAASVHDQAHLAGLFDAGDVTRLFTATAEIRAMLVIEGALAKVQGKRGIIPELSAQAIHRASLELQIDPGGLAAATAQNGVCVPALVAAFREAMQAPEHAQYMHWGATSQDIIDTGLMLRLRQASGLIDASLEQTLTALAALAGAHADTPMAGRTYGQQAAPTSFGAVVASWGWPLLEARRAFAALEFPVSLSGAAGTGSALGPDPAVLRGDLAEALKLSDPGHSWHTDRSPVLRIAEAAMQAITAFGTMGEDLIALAQTEVGEVTLGGAGASSTMPQKQNPVAPSALVAIARLCQGLHGVLHGAAMHRFQRDGAAWFTEWMALPQIVMGAAAAAQHGHKLAEGMQPNPARMAAHLQGDGLLHAEALSFALAAQMPRPEAQLETKRLAAEVRETGQSLGALAMARYPDLPASLFMPAAQLGSAPQEARAFAAQVRGA
ncbi:adenylosuccinate lyase family protein [Aliishimia ponticola]|uniref:Adenylosuccinate lyase family protein n=1 Tax=Aliishimia ponticola TaxID=2499833 RepID=A0A4V3XKI7_9RHOB|nr:lyase family protein [Aliishimia ponticola]THH37123.1 adenylosuccinate lyase family protein [Aliishimia ponticola]